MIRKKILALALIESMGMMSLGLLAPVYSVYLVNRISISIIDLGLIYMEFNIVSAIFKGIIGYIVEVIDRKKLYVFGAFLNTLTFISYIFANNVFHLIIIEFMSGVAYAIEGPITLSLLTEMLDDKKYGREIGIVEFAKEISVAIASLVAGIVVVIIGYEAVFLLGAVFQIASVIILNNYL